MIVVNNFGALGSALSLTWLALNTGSESLYCTISVENINGYVWLVIAATVAIVIMIMMFESMWCNNWSVYRLRSSLDDNWCCSSVMVSGFRFFRFRFVNCFRFNSFLRFWFSLNNNSVVDVWVLTLVEDFSGCNLFGSWSCLYNFFN